MEVERRERAVRLQVLLTEGELQQLWDAALKPNLPVIVKELLSSITGIRLDIVKQPLVKPKELNLEKKKTKKTKKPKTSKKWKRKVDGDWFEEKKPEKPKKQKGKRKEQQALTQAIVAYLNKQRYANKWQLSQALGNPAELLQRDFIDKLVTKGILVEVDWKKLGLRKGIYYAVPDSPAVTSGRWLK